MPIRSWPRASTLSLSPWPDRKKGPWGRGGNRSPLAEVGSLGSRPSSLWITDSLLVYLHGSGTQHVFRGPVTSQAEGGGSPPAPPGWLEGPEGSQACDISSSCQGFQVAYVVFQKPNGVSAALALKGPLLVSTESHPVKSGIHSQYCGRCRPPPSWALGWRGKRGAWHPPCSPALRAARGDLGLALGVAGSSHL